MPVVRRVVVASRHCDAFHVFHGKTEQLGNFPDTMSAQQTTHNPRLTFLPTFLPTFF